MNVLFIYSLQEIQSLKKPLRSQELIQLGISYISAILKQKKHKTKVVVLSRENGDTNNKQMLHSSIDAFKPQLLCFTAVSSEYPFIASIARYLKKQYPKLYFLIGGVHASLNPVDVLKDSFDALCIGEGEYPTLELVNSLEQYRIPSQIENLWFKRNSVIEKNRIRPYIEDLDNVPFLDRTMWQEWIEEREYSQHSVLLGRGCPFECSYCSNHALKKIAEGRYVRLRTVENIIKEIEQIATAFPENRNVYLEIETFFIDKKWSLELCKQLAVLNESLSKPLRFGMNLRIMPNTDYDELFKESQKSNVRFINIGLESGSEKIRKNILRRIYSNDDVIKTVKTARKYNLKVAFYNIIGLPEEAYEDFQETKRVNRMCLPDWIMTSIFFPYPGTDLYELCKSRGYFKGELDTQMERSKAVLDLPLFPKKQVQKAYEWFYFDVYNGYKPLPILFLRVFTLKLRKFPRLFSFYLTISRCALCRKLISFLKKKNFWR